MDALAFAAQDAEDLNRTVACGAEPVRHGGVELGDLAEEHPPVLKTHDRYGFRVPLIVVSPYSRPGYVSDRVTDHASITRFLQTRYLMPALTARDANAWPFLDMFDFTQAALLTPPALDEKLKV